MSPKLHQQERQFMNPIQKVLVQKSFGKFTEELMKSLNINNVVVQVSSFDEQLLYNPGHKFIVEDFWMGIETATIETYLVDIKNRAIKLLNEALDKTPMLASQISFLQRQINTYWDASSRYNNEDYEFFLKGLQFLINGSDGPIPCSYLQLQITSDHYKLMSHNLAVRRNLLGSIARDIRKLLNEIISTFEYAPKFSWSSATSELDITEIGLAIINSPNFSTLNGEHPSLFMEKLLQLFGYSGKAISKNRGNIVKRRRKESVINVLNRSIDSLIETTPISKTRQKKS